jgi:hypothetical protein
MIRLTTMQAVVFDGAVESAFLVENFTGAGVVIETIRCAYLRGPGASQYHQGAEHCGHPREFDFHDSLPDNEEAWGGSSGFVVTKLDVEQSVMVACGCKWVLTLGMWVEIYPLDRGE